MRSEIAFVPYDPKFVCKDGDACMVKLKDGREVMGTIKIGVHTSTRYVHYGKDEWDYLENCQVPPTKVIG